MQRGRFAPAGLVMTVLSRWCRSATSGRDGASCADRPVRPRSNSRRAAQDYLTPRRRRWMIMVRWSAARGFQHGSKVAARDSGRGFVSRTEPTAMATGTRRLDIEEVGDVTVAKFTDKKILDETN